MVNFKEDEQLNMLNHSCAHLMAQAVKHLYPQAKFWVGPVVAEGFYYDIDLGDDVIRDEDISAIEKEMKKVAKSGKKIIRHEITKEEALEMFKDDSYKLDLISNLEDGNISCYTQGDFTDLCRGPHVDNVKLCRHFKLIRHSGAYWKGDSKNKMLQRIYGVCFPTAEELEAHLQLLEEAKERDHRKIGKDMGLFMVDDLVGRGLPMFLPKGYVIWQELENYIKNKERKLGYLHVMTPCVGTVDLYKTSGHWDHYKDNMFPAMEVEGESFVLRPMNCPHHMMIYANRIHSYKDLPIRIGEIAHDFRFEASGTLKGIERGRHFCQNDAHLFVTPEQIKDEFSKVVDLIFSTYKDFGITDYRCVLSLRDPEDKEKYHDDDEMWNKAENALREVMDSLGIEYTEEIGEAAFYGPKLDVNVKPAVGNEYTLSTCQLDFCLPAKFELTYVDRDGEKKTPVVRIDFFPGMSEEELKSYLQKRTQNRETYMVSEFLLGLLNQKLITVLLKTAGIPEKLYVKKLKTPDWDRLISTLKRLELVISDTNGFDNAQVCAGGVNLTEIASDTMESRICKDLYLAGELLDVDGICGGYNLQWAWASGYLAGCAAAGKKNTGK